MLRNLPNALTILRLLAAPLLALVLIFSSGDFGLMIALVIFVVASLTDYLDGFFARRLDQISPFGAMLDPIADKAMVVLTLAFLNLAYGNDYDYLISIPTALILFREILISGIREYFGVKSGMFAVTFLSKAKTAVQMIAITILLASSISTFENELLYLLGVSLLWIAASLTLITGWSYLSVGLDLIRNKK